MSATVAEASRGYFRPNRVLTLAGLFWAFSYALLTIRGALFHDDWTQLIDNNRLLAVTVGAFAYGLVLRQLRAGARLTLRGTVTLVLGATVVIMAVRLAVDELMFDAPQGVEINLLWSLTWSAYFALWVMGSLAFAPVTAAELPKPVSSARAIGEPAASDPARIDALELMVISIMAEAADLRASDRAALTARVMALGGYESADGSPGENERARLALRLAARLSEIR